MSKYNTFLSLFIISVAAAIFFMIFYIRGIFAFAFDSNDFFNYNRNHDPGEMFRALFSPPVIISLLIMTISGLTARILGIVCVATNKTVSDGEKAIWIVGFIIMGFVTAIVFIIMAKGKKFVDQ